MLKSIFFLLAFYFFLNEINAQMQVRFDIIQKSLTPIKLNDTITGNISDGEYQGMIYKITFHDKRGESTIQISDKKGITRVKGFYSNCPDTLSKYQFSKSRYGKTTYKIIHLKYFVALPSGNWRYYDKKGELTLTKEENFDFLPN